MMETTNVSAATGSGVIPAGTDPTSGLGSDDFFKLLIAQLINQDPLEPTSNQELLNQISSIRDIELSTNLSDSLQSLTDQQRFASAASMIGQFVRGVAEDAEAAVSGIVRSVRFDAGGKALLELEDGQEIPLDAVGSVMNGERAAEALRGRLVAGLDRSDPTNPQVIEGVVTGVRTEDSGRIVLELDTGQELNLSDLLDAQSLETPAG
jgi:flagellar basal-body rod modification protein FlgD